ncbi:glucose galactose transporter [Ilyonectria robusta]|uniref:glucose galactose transporter n=1 Tax=Ilyonectria robusta TaxID=1079257 RepID=UPI001E8E37A9|nr:glucose galactose transporter [Ilyonectria robusta]KAH8672307.1 glucose galactose transporter [Ilyonectria robusta]
MFRKRNLVTNNAAPSAAQLTARQSLLPNLSVTTLFFLWGFAYGLLDVLNSHFQSLLNISGSMASGLAAAYFGAYFICPPTLSGYIVRRFGFRATFVTGLFILAVGCLLFWPSGVKKSFAGFCGSMFVVGCGLSTLETAANPFLAICGPPKYSEIRLNLAQGVQGTGSFVAPLLASRVFFAHTLNTEDSLANMQWVYLGVAGFVACLIVIFLVIPMPEITDADMANLEGEINDSNPGPFRKQYNLFLAVFSQFCYVGAQVAVANYFINFCLEQGKTHAQGSDLLAVAQGLYTANRFIAAGLMMMPAFKPRLILATYLALCSIFIAIAIATKGATSIAFLILVFCAESACFACIFATGLRGLGRHTKRGGSFLVAAISGATAFTPATGALMDATNASTAMVIPLTGYVLASVYPLYINVWNKELMDSHRSTMVGIEPKPQEKEDVERNSMEKQGVAITQELAN